MEINKIGIVGCGVMGAGIAQLCAQTGLEVVISEKDEITLHRGMATIGKALRRLEEKGRIKSQAIIQNINATTEINDFSICDLVIECVTEDLGLKKHIFRTLDGICQRDAILATNTSVLSIGEMAGCTTRPDKVIGTHFLTPAPVNKLLEIVVTDETSDETLRRVKQFSETVGKTSIVAKDNPGFVVNRVLTSIMFNAVRLLEEGVATKEDIETAMQLGLGLPMGPLKLLDLIGIDTVVLGSEALFKELNEQQYRPPETLLRMVSDGLLGRKTGKGFYEYPDSPGAGEEKAKKGR
jgi:3-hydroxybutyryl-CoA dehydrogenase